MYFYSGPGTEDEESCKVFDVDVAEVKAQMMRFLKKMKAGKSCADDGLVAEMLQNSSETFLEMLALLFSDLLSGRGGIPEEWKCSRLMVLYKKGDARLPHNYRPIMILPVLSKLFSGILLERMSRQLEESRTPEEMGFRKAFNCSDLVHMLRMLGEKAAEWGETVWMASLDLEKAFDKLLHTAVFEGLECTQIDPCTIAAVRSLYTHNRACIQVRGGSRSRVFSILRGVRQGDPLSPALFTNTVRVCMHKLKESWERRRLGTIIGSSDGQCNRITFAMFAVETTLVAKSKKALKLMLREICKELCSIGLNVNTDKCSVQHSSPDGHLSLVVDGQTFPVVSRDVGFKVLGVQFTLNGNTRAEFDSRMRSAYGKFSSLQEAFLKRDSNLCKRLQLSQIG